MSAQIFFLTPVKFKNWGFGELIAPKVRFSDFEKLPADILLGFVFVRRKTENIFFVKSAGPRERYLMASIFFRVNSQSSRELLQEFAAKFAVGLYISTGFVGTFILDMFVDTKKIASSCVVAVVVVVVRMYHTENAQKARSAKSLF